MNGIELSFWHPDDSQLTTDGQYADFIRGTCIA